MGSSQDEVVCMAQGARPVLRYSLRATHFPARGTSLSPAQPSLDVTSTHRADPRSVNQL